MTANRVAMSKALGAAFLSHQVEQLEQKVSGGGSRGGGGGGSWREGRKNLGQGQGYQRGGGGFGSGSGEYGREGGGRGRGGGRRRGGVEGEREYGRGWRGDVKEREEKDADVIVVDVSVLVHGIAQLKKWCREGRSEVVIIPLEGTPFIITVRYHNHTQ